MLEHRCVLVVVTGGIACYKACEVVSSLRKAGADVCVVMTENATKFVSPLTFETLSNNPVAVDTFRRDTPWEVEHVSLAKRADIAVVVPATANVIGKMACGIADDMATTTLLAVKAPIVVCPAMNVNMYENEAVRDNIALLKKRGFLFVEADEGFLACGDVGKGRLAAPAVIVQKVVDTLMPVRDYCGKRVLVTAGATREDDMQKVLSMYIDSLKETKAMDTAVSVTNVFQSGEWLYVDMTAAFQSSIKKLGRDKAAQALNGMLNTMRDNFPPVKKIKFYVNSKEITEKTPVDLTTAWTEGR